MRELVQLVEHGTANLDDGELCGVGGIRRGREDTQVPLDLAFGTDRVEEAGDGVPVGLGKGLDAALEGGLPVSDGLKGLALSSHDERTLGSGERASFRDTDGGEHAERCECRWVNSVEGNDGEGDSLEVRGE